MTTFEKLKKIISEQLYVDESKITMDSDIVEDFEADSIEMVDIVMDIEDEFGVEIPDDAMETMHRIGDVVEYIDANK
ncbi:MAG: acyl carrier protein [Oscillospiraceae bacterium]|nr:acyl carrier protein [Oscillospiraceae bacterium]MDY4586092.1 acyl carrier protein [Oscillospiraceae bacterium]